MNEAGKMLLAQIKAQTKVYHDELEQGLDIFHTVQTLADYTALLHKFLGFYQPLEAQITLLQSHTALPLNFDPRKKSQLLQRDLHVLDPHYQERHANPFCQDLPELSNAAQVCGSLYVLEGATLGGTIIAKYIKEQFALSDMNGCSFFRSYGHEVGPMWHSFLEMLVAYAASSQQEAQIIDSARATFASLCQWLLSEPNLLLHKAS